jgi:putative MATE family efflux protein
VGASVIIGLMASVVGLVFSTPMLQMMGSPEDVLPLASLYLKIYFCGMPFNIAYNFGAAVLRAVGDTKRPLYILTLAGLANVVLNLITVIFFHMGVAGVAIATVASQVISAVLVIRALALREDCCHLNIKEMHIYRDKLIDMIKVGLPAGIQGSLFSLANVIIQSAVNSFGSVVVAGNAAAANLEGFVYSAMNAIYQASITFISQNLGAQKPKRILKVMGICLVVVSVVGLTLGNLMYLFGEPLLSIYCSDSEGLQAEMIRVGLTRMSFLAVPYFLCGLMEIGCGGMRGLGWSWVPTTVSLLGACGIRILWIFTVFRQIGTLSSLYVSYPISWGVTFLAHMVCFFFVFRGVKKKFPEETAA